MSSLRTPIAVSADSGACFSLQVSPTVALLYPVFSFCARMKITGKLGIFCLFVCTFEMRKKKGSKAKAWNSLPLYINT